MVEKNKRAPQPALPPSTTFIPPVSTSWLFLALSLSHTYLPTTSTLHLLKRQSGTYKAPEKYHPTVSFVQDPSTGEFVALEGAETLTREVTEGPMAESRRLGIELKALQAESDALDVKRRKLLKQIGNLVHDSVPVAESEEKNEVVREVGAKRGDKEGEYKLHHHHELLHMIGGYEPERGVKVTGHRGYFLTGPGVELNLALIQYALSFLNERGYKSLQTPFTMNKDVMAETAQLEDFDEALYKVSGDGDDEKYLIATSEQPISAYHRGEWIPEKQLPIKYGGYSTCFRKEAGSHGKDAWGIFRVHQFEKIEQFCITSPDDDASWKMHEEMLTAAEDFNKSLGISYRVIVLVSKELNNAAAKKYDLEGWFPARQEYKELVSCSNCTDYQSRDMEVRCGTKSANERSKRYVHMLNSTLCATTRTICAILEQNQTPEGVTVPEVLRPFVGGKTIWPYVNKPPKVQKKQPGNSGAGKKASK